MTDPLFLVEHFDPKENFRWETVNSQWTRRNVIEGIYDGVLDCVTAVWEIRKDEGTCKDVTLDIAAEVQFHGRINGGRQFSYNVLTFLQSQGLETHQMVD